MMNWQKVKLVLAVIRLAGNRLEKGPSVIAQEEEKIKVEKGIDETLIKYIILPDNKKYIVWLVFMSLVYIASYWSDPFDMAFDLTPL